MKKLILLAFSFLLIFGSLQAQSPDEIWEAANQYALANLNEDYELLLDFTYPQVIEQAGGREAYKKVLLQMNELQKNRGMSLSDFIVKEPLDKVKAGDEWHVVVPYQSVTKVKGGRLTSENTLIAVAAEGKSKWYFVETASLTERNLAKVLPNWNNTLILPYKKAPIFKED
ncbi:hypothetical protein KIH41_05715 [Litoribacter ruber]|uniref:DUF4019 domain-containing protein n=1 Tax=Litoribacter ruber TaxID=702568 RepID=A0AAP2CJS6_9BACT|nr:MULTISPECIES: hypothetical protein [Litoribacter]MBS9523062.1 hypothetical protein [Litoribacter alkaliphilus]MBT0810774.1 hypothetical protein [Litoribacter ruber]